MATDTASSSSSAACPPKKYDVFISFRGEDTRSNFTSHLHNAFCRNQIVTYIDDRLYKGDEISSALMQAIQDSYVSVVVFSENYATSRWCLDELTTILQCKRDQGQHVIPVFYKVLPTHVRHQTGPYQQAFQEYYRKLMHNQQKISKWKAALTEAASLAGWDSHTIRDEHVLIQKIVKDVLRKLKYRYQTTELKGLVGIDDKCAEIKLLLEKFQTIGIWGMAGIGKTTIAKSLFFKNFSQYQGCCFLENVRENSGRHENKLHDLRYKLVSKLLEDEDLCVGTSAVEFPFVECRLMRKKVFIVLDDVSSLRQLEYLIGELRCFALGSKIVITTRDKHVLSKGVDVIYEVKELEFQESHVLFNLNAFNQSLPLKGYEELSKRAVNYAKGIPLALKVIGSFLHAKNKDEWDSALRKLEKIPSEQIQNILRISYDGLDDKEKEIFLEIACFLKGENKEHVISLLDSYGLYATIGMRTLQDKALINTIRGHVWMHDLIQEMGHELVRQECIKELGQRSRLWESEEVYDILANNNGTNKIEGIMIDVSQTKEACLSVDTFKKMPNLRYLKIYTTSDERSCKVHLPNGLESFSNKISYLEWVGYSLKSLPSTFCPEKLVELHMPGSHVKKLWDGVQDLINLKKINLDNSYKLKELPNFSKASNLKQASFQECINLQNIHPSILSCHSLDMLYLSGCKKIESLKSEIHLKSLSSLQLFGCLNLKEFSVSSEKLRYLGLDGTTIEILHPSVAHSSQLTHLYLNGSRLQKIPDRLSCLDSLESINIFNCQVIDDMMLHILFDGLRSLTEVVLVNCCNITELPNNSQHLSRLELLNLKDCKRLRSLPKLPPFIKYLIADNCTSLETVFSIVTWSKWTGVSKYISFWNCVKLDEQLVHNILEDVCSLMMQAKRLRSIKPFDPVVWLPGSRVPEWFKYGTRGASITIELPPHSHLLGFLFCVVVQGSPLSGISKMKDTIRWSCYLGSRYVGRDLCVGFCNYIEIRDLDHIRLWCDPLDSNHLLHIIKREIGDSRLATNLMLTFKFSFDKPIQKSGRNVIKECGVYPIYDSYYEDFKLAMEMQSNNKRPRDINGLELQQQILSHFKKLKLDLGTQSNINNTCTSEDVDELESMLIKISIT